MGKKRRRSALNGDVSGPIPVIPPSVPLFTGDTEPSDPRPYAITRLASLPRSLHKFWYKRHHLFSLFDESPGVLLDEQSWYSVTPECIAAWTAERCSGALEGSRKGKSAQRRPTRVLDAFCGAGGNAIQFAMVFDEVVAMDVDPLKIALARHNARIYGVEERIAFIVGDFFEFANEHKEWTASGQEGLNSAVELEEGTSRSNGELKTQAARQAFDLVYLSPPWGGITYLQPSTLPTSASHGDPAPAITKPLYATYPLSSLCAPQGGRQIIASALGISPNLALFLPRNVNLDELHCVVREEAQENAGAVEQAGKKDITNEQLREEGGPGMELEENWAGGRLRALTLYTGELAIGREV